jgi:hypothetical protein
MDFKQLHSQGCVEAIQPGSDSRSVNVRIKTPRGDVVVYRIARSATYCSEHGGRSGSTKSVVRRTGT